MAEFIFDLQRFPEDTEDTTNDATETVDEVGGNGDGEGNSSGAGGGEGGGDNGGDGEGNDNGGDEGGTTTIRDVGTEYDITKNNQDAWGTYSYAEWNAILEDAYSNYSTAYVLGTVNVYAGTTGVADNILVSRYAINEIYNLEWFDTVTFVDASLSDFAAYYYGNDVVPDAFNSNISIRPQTQYKAPALNLGAASDSGAGSLTVMHYGMDDIVSPTVAFADGNSVLYSDLTGNWITSKDLAFSVNFWSTRVDQSGQTAEAEIITASRGVNNYITNVDSNDIIYLADTSLVDLQSATGVGDGLIGLSFTNGTSTLIKYSGTYSPTFILGSGESVVYNFDSSTWMTPEAAAAEALTYTVATTPSGDGGSSNGSSSGGTADEFSFSITNNTFLEDASYEDTVTFYDATWANVVNVNVDDANDLITFTFNTGTTSTIEYWSLFSPIFQFADGTRIGYEWGTGTWGTAITGTDSYSEDYTISGLSNNLIYDASWLDDIYIPDVTPENITNASVNSLYVHLNFNVGDTTATTAVRYETDEYGYNWSPHFIVGSLGAQTGYFYAGYANHWVESSVSADLWGDTFSGTAEADGIFVGTYGNTLIQNVDAQDTITFDAVLSDIVATSVTDNTIAVAFNTGVTAVIETSGDSPTFNLASGESYTYDNQSASWKSA